MNPSTRVWVRPVQDSLVEQEVRQVVSEASPRSEKMRMVRIPESAAIRTSLVSVDSAVSVLWSGWVGTELELFTQANVGLVRMELGSNWF